MATALYDAKTGKRTAAGVAAGVPKGITEGGTGIVSTTRSSSSGSSSSSSTSIGSNISSVPTSTIQAALGATVDGSYGPETTAKVKAFQAANGLTADGIVGPATVAKMIGVGAITNSTSSSRSTTTTPSTSSTGAASSPSTSLTTSTAETKPVGLDNITRILNSGSADTTGSTQVKELQKYLNNITPDNPADDVAVDGIFGPQTKTAVMAFQRANGLTPDGIVGPLTLAKMKTIATTALPEGREVTVTDVNGETTTFNTGNPANDALLKELVDMIKKQQEAGLKINEALNFDQATLDRFLETAKKQVHPFYAQQIDAIKEDVLRTAPQILENYQSDIAGKEATFQNTLGTTREGYAGSGLAFSGQRAGTELGMQSSQNRDLSSLSQDYGNKLYNLGRGAEEKIGASSMDNLPALSQYSATLGGVGGLNQSGTYRPYTPGGFQIGSLTRDEEAAREARRQALIKTASESVVAGRSYEDLFK